MDLITRTLCIKYFHTDQQFIKWRLIRNVLTGEF